MSGEINSTVSDVAAAKARVVEAFADRATFDEFDGITAQGKPAEAGQWWWFNVRASNTEPLLRLNVEASNEDAMTQIRNEVLSLIQQKA
jgi:phosphomannomutase